MAEPGADSDTLPARFTATLDGEGYSFQQSIIRSIHELAGGFGELCIDFEVSEFPVVVRGRDMRVDFIVRISSHWSGTSDVLLVCECKRSNPALNDWCFSRTPYVRSNPRSPMVLAEQIWLPVDGITPQTAAVWYQPQRSPFHVGLPVKARNRKGDDKGNARDVIEHASSQVLSGLDGLMDFYGRNIAMLPKGKPLFMIPVIFTTASLFASDVDLARARLEDGLLPELASLESVDWLWFQYHVSQSLRHGLHRQQSRNRVASIGEFLEDEHARSIAVVNPRGTEAFLTAAGNAAAMFHRLGS